MPHYDLLIATYLINNMPQLIDTDKLPEQITKYKGNSDTDIDDAKFEYILAFLKLLHLSAVKRFRSETLDYV